MLGIGRACGMIVAWRMRSDRVGSIVGRYERRSRGGPRRHRACRSRVVMFVMSMGVRCVGRLRRRVATANAQQTVSPSERLPRAA